MGLIFRYQLWFRVRKENLRLSGETIQKHQDIKDTMNALLRDAL